MPGLVQLTDASGVITGSATNPVIQQPQQGSVQRITSGYVAPGQSAKMFIGRQATSTTVITTIALETVTTGKTLILTDIFLFTDAPQANSLDIQLQAGGANIFRAIIHQLSPLSGCGIETQPSASSGQQVNLILPITASGVVNVNFSLYGVEF